jgi:hypothetical protein
MRFLSTVVAPLALIGSSDVSAVSVLSHHKNKATHKAAHKNTHTKTHHTKNTAHHNAHTHKAAHTAHTSHTAHRRKDGHHHPNSKFGSLLQKKKHGKKHGIKALGHLKMTKAEAAAAKAQAGGINSRKMEIIWKLINSFHLKFKWNERENGFQL